MPSLLGRWTEGSCSPSGRALPRPPLLSTDGGKRQIRSEVLTQPHPVTRPERGFGTRRGSGTQNG